MESTPQNESDQMEFDRTIRLNFLITIFLQFIISLVGLAGNAVVLWLLGFCMKRNSFSVYILNLAGADFVYLFIQILNSVNFKIDLIFDPKFFYVSAFPYVASLSILTAISSERCLSVLQPMWYRFHRPKHMSSVVCALIWALSLLLCILRLEFSGVLFGGSNKYLCKLVDFSIATWLIFSFVLLFGSNLVLLARILCGSRKLKLTGLYVIIGLTVLVFLICGLPPVIYWFLLYWIPNMYKINGSTPYIVTVILLASCVNSCANPTIYFFVGIYRQQQRQQRRSLKLILQRALQDDSEEDRSQGSPPQETLEMLGNGHGS
ncbi:mas-related G-protein coupled receptor member X2-like [Sorex fumeus]|uniref:mas-related G-protein coupled receptor member X2-like n=1 Tax=Sorex fumeus TaxID=62283 RepID=UPI0024AE5687|nr:mas-related G-protein coupled receptor member X2-like [Sorex fumeus]